VTIGVADREQIQDLTCIQELHSARLRRREPARSEAGISQPQISLICNDSAPQHARVGAGLVNAGEGEHHRWHARGARCRACASSKV
jgi:hypothetical protein